MKSIEALDGVLIGFLLGAARILWHRLRRLERRLESGTEDIRQRLLALASLERRVDLLEFMTAENARHLRKASELIDGILDRIGGKPSGGAQ